MTEIQKKNQNDGLTGIIFDIVIPVIILNQLSKRLGEDGPLIALFVALLFPIGHGLYSLIVKKKRNFISLLGIINILLTGGLAVLHLEGGWFALKEAAFPLVIGLFVLGSAFTQKPFITMIFMNDSLIQTNLLEERLQERQAHEQFKKHLKNLTFALAGSFLFSAILNYLLAITIFTPIPPELSSLERSTILNEQIARMTWLGYIVIAIPSMVILMGIFWYMLRGIKRLTNLELKDIIVNH